ncbi:DUF1479-domain-containing protein [Cylindrobasidium torrendii FP15055 ss-10]|uniref:DUF1479-domain-containing protein n=1 Tax=Cylindrobasidium torrendii FP15055 ss-10 TaxID=1314674 RepID=A0A0D7B4F3_9AGAR|nr:DUF1479-domain-containing protein [Cylindrobasidium torrendii FP15055 ss-10]
MASPDHFQQIKQEIADSIPDFERLAVRSWGEIIAELAKATERIKNTGPEYIPQVEFAELKHLSDEKIAEIRRKGCAVVRNVVDDDVAARWKTTLEEHVKANPDVDGFPNDNKQFFQLYWTKPQVEARAHPNMLATTSWLNGLWHGEPGQDLKGVDLAQSLSYADRFRIRHPGGLWINHPPHVDGGSIERWEDPTFRSSFHDILSGEWRKHDAFNLGGRITARHSMYRRPNQASIFRSFQGWLAMSPIAPTQGTLKVFPDILLSNAYLILRPFFRPVENSNEIDVLNAENWKFDISSPDFAGLTKTVGGWHGPRPTPELHPHMRLEEAMTSMPAVNPGDTVWWHCDMVHSVEEEHTGDNDSAVMYIPAMPLTSLNKQYIDRQLESFLRGVRPPDYPDTTKDENTFVGTAKAEDIKTPDGRLAMGLPLLVA